MTYPNPNIAPCRILGFVNTCVGLYICPVGTKTPRTRLPRGRARPAEARLQAERQAEEEARLEAERRVEEALQLNQAVQPLLEEARWEEKPLDETVPEERIQSDSDPLLGSPVQPVATEESPPQPSAILLPPPEPVLPVVPTPSDPPVMAP